MNGKNENIGNEDIIEVALPDYTEEQSAIPDVETEVFFAENKEEIFLRNRELAAEMSKSGESGYREEFPENPDAEEIYPQVRVVPENNLTGVSVASEESGKPSVKDSSKRKHKKLGRLETICASIVIAVVAIAAIVVVSNGASVTSGGLSVNAAAVERADEKAKTMFVAAAAGLTQLFIDGKEVSGTEFENSGTVFSFGGTEVNTADYLGNSFSGYVWGAFDPELGAVEYALWSAEPIPDEYKRALTDSEQEALAKEGIIIGCYPSYGE